MPDAVKKKVFVIEDDQFLLKTCQLKFEKEGFEVWACADGAEAFTKIKDQAPPDIVILDLMMPSLSGFDLLSAIRSSDTWKNVPVFIFTNLGQPQDQQQAQKFGVQAYLVKAQVRIGDLVAKVHAFLNGTPAA